MKIRKVEVIPFAVPIRGFADAYTGFTTSNAVLVKIYSEDDTIGYNSHTPTSDTLHIVRVTSVGRRTIII